MVRMEMPCAALWRPTGLDWRVLYPSRGLELTSCNNPGLLAKLCHVSIIIIVYIIIIIIIIIRCIYIYIYIS